MPIGGTVASNPPSISSSSPPCCSGIATQTRCVDEAAIARLDDMRAALEEHRPVGLTEKNMALIRQVLSSDVWRLVVNLPWQLMQRG